MQEEGKQRPVKAPLPLDLNSVWDQISPRNDDAESAQAVVLKHISREPSRPKTKPPPPPPPPHSMAADYLAREDLRSMPDHKLKESINSKIRTLESYRRRLPDGGKKIASCIKALEEEHERRERCRAQMDVDHVCEKNVHSKSASVIDVSDGFRREKTSALPQQQQQPQSEFSTHLHRRIDNREMEENSCSERKLEENRDGRAVNAFDKELSIMGHCNDHQKVRSNGISPQRSRKKGRQSTKAWPFTVASRPSLKGDKHGPLDVGRNGKAFPTSIVYGNGLLNGFHKKDDHQVLPSNDSRPRKKGKAVVFVDEDETQLVETTGQDKELTESMKDVKIYYPSSDDPGCVEICYTDMKCLDPEGFLTSPIMNFYIRYLPLQLFPTNQAIHNFLFFNTFFYEKLKQAVSYKWEQLSSSLGNQKSQEQCVGKNYDSLGNDKEPHFAKFRRWWKGVNIFQKSYIFIPIHKDHHWSLVVICIPDKVYKSGAVILHFDSLELHNSSSVCGNIKSYLIKEWEYMKQKDAISDLIEDGIWENFPRRIETKPIQAVAQQKNDYDCGLFVLFFIERFIDQFSERRLRRTDLDTFGKRWFRPEEASGLRVKIRNLLKIEFQKASQQKSTQSSPSSSSDGVLPESGC